MKHLYTAAVSPRQGFHFSLTTTLLDFDPTSACPSGARPILSLRYTIPPALFVDPYELELHRAASPYPFKFDISYEPDLELPVFAARQEDAVVTLNATLSLSERGAIDVSIPVHARYGTPVSPDSEIESKQEGNDGGFEMIQLDPPHAMLSCLPPSAGAL